MIGIIVNDVVVRYKWLFRLVHNLSFISMVQDRAASPKPPAAASSKTAADKADTVTGC